MHDSLTTCICDTYTVGGSAGGCMTHSLCDTYTVGGSGGGCMTHSLYVTHTLLVAQVVDA